MSSKSTQALKSVALAMSPEDVTPDSASVCLAMGAIFKHELEGENFKK